MLIICYTELLNGNWRAAPPSEQLVTLWYDQYIQIKTKHAENLVIGKTLLVKRLFPENCYWQFVANALPGLPH